jgi:hypothetical protein
VFALSVIDAEAAHGGDNVVHACVKVNNENNGQVRIVNPGDAPHCRGNEILIDLASGAIAAELNTVVARLDDLEGQVASLESENQTLRDDLDSLSAQVPDCMATEGGDAVFEGCNVHVRNGMGSTGSTNGAGNLIVGYNENDQGFNRAGSHNIVIGRDHGYSSFGGLVAGQLNQITGMYASVTGGTLNEATGLHSIVSGGRDNVAQGQEASVSGGGANLASGRQGSVTGGLSNTASATQSSVSGGQTNLASGRLASVTGGVSNTASGIFATVSGGAGNTASGDQSTVSGGAARTAAGLSDWVGGGLTQNN